MSQIRNITSPDFRVEPNLPLETDQVHLWRVDFSSLRGHVKRWAELLSSDESMRASRFHAARDREYYMAARAVLRIVLAAYVNTEPASLLFSYSQKDKPSLAPTNSANGLTFNISHSGGAALLAFARSRDVGVDIEQVRRDFDVDAIARRFFSAREQEQLARMPSEERVEFFFRCWTRKEAYIKATGDGLSLPLTQFDVSLDAGSNDALLATRPDPKEAERWSLREVPAGAGYVAALCARGRDWKLKDWPAEMSALKKS